MLLLRQSTASQSVVIGPFVDSTDGDTAETGLTIANTDILLSKNGGALTAKNSGGGTHDADGWYAITLDATDSATLGRLQGKVHVAGALPVHFEAMVLPANVYDSLVLGTDTLNSAVTEWNGTALATTDPFDAVATASKLLKYVQLLARSDAAITTDNATELSAINADGGSGAGDYSNNIDSLENLSLVVDNLQFGPDETEWGEIKLAASTFTPNIYSRVGDPSNLGSGASLAANAVDIAGGTFSSATDSLEAIRDRGDAAWSAGASSSPQLLQNTTIATLASQTSFTLTAGSADDDAYNGAVAVFTDQTTGTQKAFVAISGYVGTTKTVTLSAAPAFTIAVGDTIDIIATASDAPTAAAIRAEIDTNSTQLAAIVEDTNELQTDWVEGGRLDLILDARASQTSVDTVDGIVDAILVDTAEIGAAGAGLTAIPWNAAWDAEVQSEVDDALDAFVCDTGVGLAKLGEIVAALAAGQVTVSSVGGVSTMTYKKRDGTTTSFTTVVTEADKTRATTGALS